MYGYCKEDEDFTFSKIEGLNPYTMQNETYGTLVYYKVDTVLY